MSKVSLPGLKDSKGERFQVRDPGTYNCRITKVEEKEAGENAKHPGRPYWNFKACIKQGEEFEGHPFFFMVQVPCEGMTKEELTRCANGMKCVMNACQMPVESDESVDSQDFIGQELALVVTVSQYQGKDKNEVKDYLTIDENSGNSPDDKNIPF